MYVTWKPLNFTSKTKILLNPIGKNFTKIVTNKTVMVAASHNDAGLIRTRKHADNKFVIIEYMHWSTNDYSYLS